MTEFAWIIGSGVLMTGVSLVGGVTLFMRDVTLQRLLLPLVAFSAGSLIGGAFFHLIPEAVATLGSPLVALTWVAGGFVVFLVIELLLHHHHCHRADAACRKPLTYLILIGDGLHNFLGGMVIAAMFLADVGLGIVGWLAAAAHEIPQELGDFGVLVHGGWRRRDALLFNVLSASTFLLGGLLTYAAAERLDVDVLVPFAAGNFLYIGASDLVPELNKPERLATACVHLAAFLAGLAVLLVTRLSLGA